MADHSHEQPVKVSLKVKAITCISLLVLVVGASLSWYFLRQTERVLTRELQRRGLSLVTNLAYNSTYGVLIEDTEILQNLIKGVLHEDSVLSVRIADAQGAVLAQGSKERQDPTSPSGATTLAVQDQTALAPQVTAASIRSQVLGDREVYRAVAPVETTEAPASALDQQLDAAISLLGPTDVPEPRAVPPTVRLGSVQVVLSPEALQANIHKTFATGIWLTCGIVLVGVLVAFVFSSYMLAPVQAMARAASQIAAGDLSQRVEVTSRDEIGVLAMTFNRMTTSLEQRLAELSASHAIGVVISSTLSLERLIDLALNATVTHLHYDRAMLFLVDEAQQTLVHGRIAGVADDIRARLQDLSIPLRDDCGFHARVALYGEPVLIEDMASVKDQAYRPVTDLLGTQSLLALPIKVEDRVLGVLSVENLHTNRRLTQADQHLLSGLANQMAVGIANASAYRQIERLNIGLEEKVQERTEALQFRQGQLQELNRQLEITSRLKSEFLANMSHELRTPLNAIIGFSDVLLEKMFGELNDKQEEYLDDILGSGKYLLSLINDILDLSKIEAGKLELELSRFDLRALLENSLVMVKELAQAHAIPLVLEVSDDLGSLSGDERKVKQIVFNLLSNAVKFTPDGGKVGIKATRADDVVQIVVWDTGVGISAADQRRIFEEFQQVGTGLTDKTEGTGLGLTLTKKFVELHGGAIGVESTPGAGSTFTFTLPDQAADG